MGFVVRFTPWWYLESMFPLDHYSLYPGKVRWDAPGVVIML